MQFRFALGLVAALAVAAPLHAQDYRAGALRVGQPYARATVAGQPSGAAYLAIENTGRQADRLLAVASPIAATVEIHTMSMEGDVMRMREVPSIELKPSSKIAMQPGDGHHLMLQGLKKPLQAGDRFPMTLTFERSGKLEIEVAVQGRQAEGRAHKH